MTQSYTVTYLHHSGFMVASGDQLLIFDYYSNPTAPGLADQLHTLVSAAAASAKQVTILASHQHHDHYDPKIWQFEHIGPPCTFILSRDIPDRQIPATQTPLRLQSGESLQTGALQVTAFGSTDAGVSFLVDLPGLRLFHAGDLNWWNWLEESTPVELAEYERAFRSIIADLRPAARTIDCAFFPVDSRLGTVSHAGAEIFLDVLQPNHFFPMHFAWDYAETDRFAAMMTPRFPQSAIHRIAQTGERFILT